MIRLKHYRDSFSLGNKYTFGLNVYRDTQNRSTIDLIIGKHVFVMLIGKY